MEQIPLLFGLGAVSLVMLVLGGYLGKHGFVYTFADQENAFRIPLILVSAIPFPIVLWMQETYGYSATPIHIAIVFGCFIGAFFIGVLSR